MKSFIVVGVMAFNYRCRPYCIYWFTIILKTGKQFVMLITVGKLFIGCNNSNEICIC